MWYSIARSQKHMRTQMSEITPFIKHTLTKHFKAVLFLVIILLTLLAWSNRFITDDAFISFRYAENLVNGNGLTWNPGERVEGYTNFLWTLLMSIPIYLRIDPVKSCYVLGMVFFSFSLIFTYKLSNLIFRSQFIGLLVVILVGTNYTFSAYATGGLETQLQTCIIVAIAYLLFRCMQLDSWSPGILIKLSLLSSAALLTRLDSAIYIIVVYAVLLYKLFKQRITEQNVLSQLSWLCLPALLIVGGWFLWKLSYYGYILPNTYYVKASSITSPVRGLYYCCLFLTFYWLVPFPFLFLFAGKRIFSKFNSWISIIALMVIFWLLYIVKVGGGFMEFRLFVPVMPFLFILITWLLVDFIKQREIMITLIGMILIGSLFHSFSFSKLKRVGDIESVRKLHEYVTDERYNWSEVGRVLGSLFYNEKFQVITAGTVAGTIPYYSHLETVDMLGLNDRWIAKNGRILGGRPGHIRIATLDYLLDREVNLLVGPPLIEKYDYTYKYSIADFFLLENDDLKKKYSDMVPTNSKIVEIPLNDDYKISVLYLLQNDYVDEVIRTHKLKTYPISK